MNTNYWQGQHIRLRAIEPTDGETFYRWNQDSERNRMLDFVWQPSSRASQVALAEEASKKKPEGDSFHWIIENLAGEAAGTIDTFNCNPRAGTFSYAVDVACEHRGKGYASEAICLVLRYYFEELRYQKVTAPVHSDNEPSIRLHEKLGFKREGTLRRMMYTGGKYIDEHWYGMTVEEFQALYGKPGP